MSYMNIEIDAKICSPDGNEQPTKIKIENVAFITRGTFGKVFKANITDLNQTEENNNNNIFAIKKVLNISNRLNRELHILRRVNHPNILSLKYYYLEHDKQTIYLNLVLEYVQSNLKTLYQNYTETKDNVPPIFTRVIMYQLLRGIAYLHFKGIAHRDIKPLNLMVESPKHTLKIGDFGSAKKLVSGDTNLSYICSRYYRAPELVFGSKHYDTKIDVWSAGCVLAELLLGRPFFMADSSIDLICEMSKVLGTPTTSDLAEINSAFCKFSFPKLQKNNLNQYFRCNNDVPLITLLSKMLVFSPSARIEAHEAIFDDSFKDLFELASACISKGNLNVPSFVNFTDEELAHFPKYEKLKSDFESMITDKIKSLNEDDTDSVPFSLTES